MTWTTLAAAIMGTDPKDIIADQLSAPASESIDGQTVTERPIADLAGDQHINGGKELKKRNHGLG